MDETSFLMFESFDFENNQHFQAGWRAIEQLILPEKKNSEYLRAQAFYFSKNVQSFDFNKYLSWRDRKQSDHIKMETVGDKDTDDCTLYTLARTCTELEYLLQQDLHKKCVNNISGIKHTSWQARISLKFAEKKIEKLSEKLGRLTFWQSHPVST